MTPSAQIVGVLAVQGNFQEHMDLLSGMKVDATEVRSVADLSHVQKLIIPGGESTVIAKMLETTKLDKEIVKRVKKKTLSVFGTCAGAIVLANKVIGEKRFKPLGLIDVTLERNAYGSQLQSFDAAVPFEKKPLQAAFIRAPKITKKGRKVEVLASFHESPVLVRQGSIMLSTFHPEMRGETRVHQLWIG